MKTKIKKYQLLNESLEAIKGNTIKLLILKGEPGFGKTHSVLKYVKENKLNYKYVNNYATPLSFYQLLYENRKRDIIIFDDLQSMNDPKIKSMFKSICWESENNKRKINYHSTSFLLEKHNLPSSFEISNHNLKIILIFNDNPLGFESIIGRGILISLNFSFDEKLEIFNSIKTKAKIDDDVLAYTQQNCNQATKNLSIRTLVILSDLKKAGHDFKLFADEILNKDDRISELINLSAKEWCDKNGHHRATYYRRKKRLNL